MSAINPVEARDHDTVHCRKCKQRPLLGSNREETACVLKPAVDMKLLRQLSRNKGSMVKASVRMGDPVKWAWAIDVSGLVDYITGLCEEVIEMAVFGPYSIPEDNS